MSDRSWRSREAFSALVTLDSPTQRVGERPAAGFVSIKHNISLYSLENSFDIAEFAKWEAGWQRKLETQDSAEYVCELKIDGSASALTYENGLLIRGAMGMPGKISLRMSRRFDRSHSN